MLRLGLYFLIRSILYTRQSIFPWHFLRTAKFLAKSRDLGVVSWSRWRCLQMDEELRQCSSILWKRFFSNRIRTPLQPIYTSRKLGDALSVKEQKPSLINQHSVVYKFSCPLCDAGYMGLTTRHLFQRIEEHCRSSSSICRHLQRDHDTTPRSLDLAKNFAVLRKCQGKMDCLVYQMLLIKKYRPSLNIQSDSIRAKVFTWLCVSLCQVTGWFTGLEQ